MAFVPGGEGKGAGREDDGVSSGQRGLEGNHMQTIVSLLKDRAGASSLKLAMLIGLSSSAVLVLVRIGVATAGQ
jgi:hypothetical protein